MISLVKSLLYEEDGQGMTEYGLVLGIISIAAFGTILLLTDELEMIYSKVVDAVESRTS